MRTTVTLTLTLALGLACADHAVAQTWQPPTDAQRCPSKWGRDDQRGSGNHMKPETVLRAARLIRTGEVFELGQVLSDAMPLFGGRRFEIVTKRTRKDPGTNRRGSNEELVVFRDRPGRHPVRHLQPPDDRREHVQLRPARRGGEPHRLHQARRRAGRRAGHARRADRRRRAQEGPGAGRVLRDHAAGSAAGAGRAEAHAAARRRRARPHRVGHALGQGQRALPEDQPRPRDRRRRVAGQAGSDARRGGQLGGGSGSPSDPQLAGPGHQILLVVNGIHLLENLRLDQLAASRAYEFALVVEPLKIKGGTGSTVAPIAIR